MAYFWGDWSQRKKKDSEINQPLPKSLFSMVIFGFLTMIFTFFVRPEKGFGFIVQSGAIVPAALFVFELLRSSAMFHTEIHEQ